MTADPITYCDDPGCRVLDLRPDGVACIPVLGYSNFIAIRRGPDFHYHPGCIEFCLCLKGNLIFDTPEREYPFMPGHVFSSAPDEPHHLRTNPSGLIVYRLLFKIPVGRRRLLGLDARGSEWVVRALTHLPNRLFVALPDVRAAFERLFRIYDALPRKSPARPVKMRAASLDLLIALIESSRHTSQRPNDDMNAIAKRIQERPDADYPIEALARETKLSVSAFALAFKQANGLPLHAYLLNCRITRAKKLLLGTNRTVTAIGQSLRFYSTQHFAKTFKRIIGVNPQVYRSTFQSGS